MLDESWNESSVISDTIIVNSQTGLNIIYEYDDDENVDAAVDYTNNSRSSKCDHNEQH